MTKPDDEAYVAYVSARMPQLRRAAYLLCGDWSRGDDLVQRALTDVYRSWSRAARAESLDAYVRGVLAHRFIDDRRHRWSKVTLTDSVPEQPATASDDPDLRLDIRSALSRLPPRQRAVLVLRFLLDMSVAETATALSCAPGTVKSQTAHGLAALRRLLTTSLAEEQS